MNDFDTFQGDLFPPPSPPELKRQRVESNESEHDSYEEPVPKITSRPAALPPPQPPIYVQGELYRPLEEYNKACKLNEQFPDSYWRTSTPIGLINQANPLKIYRTCSLRDVQQDSSKFSQQQNHNAKPFAFGGSVRSLSFSDDGSLLAGASSVGRCYIWETEDWKLVQTLHDPLQKDIEELRCAKFTGDGRFVVTCGVSKSRSVWSSEDNDNLHLPSRVKVFDVLTGQVLLRMDGHQKGANTLKRVSFKKVEHWLSCGEDGSVLKWRIEENPDSDQIALTYSKEEIACDPPIHRMHSVSFLPDCGNTYFVAACDQGLRVFDSEKNAAIAAFSDLYSGKCDVVKMVQVPTVAQSEDELLLVTRGTEEVNTSGKQERANSCHLRKLTLPSTESPVFQLSLVREFENPQYQANMEFMNLAVSTRYLLAPTTTGKVFAWSMVTGQLVSIFCDHQGVVRDLAFHPTEEYLITCADDNNIQVYRPKTRLLDLPMGEKNEESNQEDNEEEDEEEESEESTSSQESVEKQQLRQRQKIPSSRDIVPNPPKPKATPPPLPPTSVMDSSEDEESSESESGEGGSSSEESCSSSED